MATLIIRRGKYLQGWSYATGLGISFSWTDDERDAYRFADDAPNTVAICNQTGGRLVHVPNTRAELRQLALRITTQPRTPDVHDRINARAMITSHLTEQLADDGPRIFVFWRHDSPSGVLGDIGRLLPDGRVKCCNYGGMTISRANMLAIYPVELGVHIMAKIEAMSRQHHQALTVLQAQQRAAIEDVLPELRGRA